MVAPPVLSESKTVTCSPRLCNSSANAIDVVVFPEPPLMIATVMMTVWFLTLMFWFPFSASGVDGIMVGVCLFVSMITTAKSRHAEPENRSEKHSSKTVERRTSLQAEQKNRKPRPR